MIVKAVRKAVSQPHIASTRRVNASVIIPFEKERSEREHALRVFLQYDADLFVSHTGFFP